MIRDKVDELKDLLKVRGEESSVSSVRELRKEIDRQLASKRQKIDSPTASRQQ